MKLGPIDFNQASTWRGILGLSGIIGISLSPELTEQIALAIGTLFAIIEIIRNEHKTKLISNDDKTKLISNDDLPPIQLQSTKDMSSINSTSREDRPPEPIDRGYNG